MASNLFCNDGSLPEEPELAFCRQTQSLPLEAPGGAIHTNDLSAENLARLAVRHGRLPVAAISKGDLIAALEQRFRSELTEAATHGLERRHPELSARRVVAWGQGLGAVAILAAGLLGAWLAPFAAGVTLAFLLCLGFVANALFRAVLVWAGAGSAGTDTSPDGADAALPRYSILVPLYREARVVEALVAALRALDYPSDRLEIALVAEADDDETLTALATASLDERFFVLAVPPGLPRTKPKAANYALQLLSGEFIVIYDAEDRPEPDQLLKAVAAFRAAPESVACLQARLNFYNARETWLTRMFALDYALWFDFLLPGLETLRVPMPLGGTSNHFRTDALRAICGWDPYNVTEDADLGIRLARLGLRVATLDSTTYEEAPVAFGTWLRQRSRWMKGYMQTWLVHMRNPARLVTHAGIGGLLGLQLFVGGTFLTALLNPLLWAAFLVSTIFGDAPATNFLNVPFAHASALSLFAGNALFTYLAMLGPYRRRWLALTPHGLAAPVYWLLISLAAYRGLWQLVVRPWHWDKTEHGLTREPLIFGEPAP